MTKSSYQQSTIIAVHLGDINLTTGCQDKDADMQKDNIDEATDNPRRSEGTATGQTETTTPETMAPVVAGQYQTIATDVWLDLMQDNQTSRPLVTNTMESNERFEILCSMANPSP